MGRGAVLGQPQDRCKASQLNSLAQEVARQDQVSEKTKSRAEPPGNTLGPEIPQKLRAARSFI
jgi:hypothetical protein